MTTADVLMDELGGVIDRVVRDPDDWKDVAAVFYKTKLAINEELDRRSEANEEHKQINGQLRLENERLRKRLEWFGLPTEVSKYSLDV